MKRLAWLCAVVALGCGADSGTNQDGGANNDAASSCSFTYSLSPATTLVAPVTIVATASVNGSGINGAQTFNWVTMFNGTEFTPTDTTGDNSEISFNADQPGNYYIALSGDINGQSCAGQSATHTVNDPNAGSKQYRLRLLPAPGQPAPVQERTIRVFGSVNATLDPISLDNGTDFGATLKGPAGSAIAAYLRVKQVGGLGGDVETFADGTGQFALWLVPALHDILVVPADETLAPIRFAAVNVTQPVSELNVPQGVAITGTVRNGAGVALANARVSLRIDDVPSTIATTDATGAFTVHARTGGTTTISVVPPASSGLPQLELGASAGLVAAAGTPLAIQYAAGASSRSVSVAITQADGTTPVPFAGTTWIADNIASVGTVTPLGAGAITATGRVRVTMMADGTGAVANLSLPETAYVVLVEPTPMTPAGELLALRSVDLSAGMPTPPSLALSVGALVSGVVRDSNQTLLGQIRVTASPRGSIANSPTTTVSTVTSASGAYSLQVVGLGSYDVRFQSLSQSYGQRTESVDAPNEGMSLTRDVDLARAVKVTAQVTIPGIPGGAAGVSVTALCFDCTGAEAVRPIAEAVSGADGVFILAIPDPEVQAPAN